MAQERMVMVAICLLAPQAATAQSMATPANCRALTLLKCAPDLCQTRPLPGGTQVQDGWIAGNGKPNLATLGYNQTNRRLSICWDRRCWTSAATNSWASGADFGGSGAMAYKFFSNQAVSGRFFISFNRNGNDLFFTLIAQPSSPDDYWVMNGDCAPAER